MTLEDVFSSIWRQTLIDGPRTVAIGEDSFPVLATVKSSPLKSSASNPSFAPSFALAAPNLARKFREAPDS
jgi:hypothetical protein